MLNLFLINSLTNKKENAKQLLKYISQSTCINISYYHFVRNFQAILAISVIQLNLMLFNTNFRVMYSANFY